MHVYVVRFVEKWVIFFFFLNKYINGTDGLRNEKYYIESRRTGISLQTVKKKEA
jgi:hypothetical protein